MNLEHVIKVRGTICKILTDNGSHKMIEYRGQRCLLFCNGSGVVCMKNSINGKYLALDAELRSNN